MRLQIKLILYNLIIKVAIIVLLAAVIVIFLDKISLGHLKQRILDKQEKLIKNISKNEITELLEAEKTFTDYNILKEEYIILSKTGPVRIRNGRSERFVTSTREIEGHEGEYLILVSHFKYGKDYYRLEIGETVSAMKQLKTTILLLTLIALILSAIITFLTDYAFTSYLLSPFYKIIEQKINKVDEPTEFDYEPVRTTTYDFRHLDESINGLMRKITQQFLTQKQFISNVSHELLTPVSVISTRLENMLAEENISEASESKIIASLKTLNRLRSIVHSLLLISKIENNQYQKTDRVNIREVLEEVKEDLEDRFVLKDIHFVNELKEEFIFPGNKALMHTLFVNIVNNGIKYNRQEGSIKVSDHVSRGIYEVVIEDEGIGMSADMISKAFNRFEKLSSRESDSHGLGLAIVKSIAVFHNISVDITSEVNHGTRVTVGIPIEV